MMYNQQIGGYEFSYPLFFYLIGNINLNRRTKNTHKMGMGNFKESAGMLKNTLCMCRGIIRLKSNPYLKANHHSLP